MKSKGGVMGNKREFPMSSSISIADIKADQIKQEGEARYQAYIASLDERERAVLCYPA